MEADKPNAKYDSNKEGVTEQICVQNISRTLQPRINLTLDNFDKDEENKLTKFFKSMGMVQLITQPTHNLGRTIDHCYVSQGHLQLDVKVMSPYYSDHSAICLKIVEAMEV